MYSIKAYRIETDRLVLRPYRIADAAMADQAIRASLPELKQWLPWSVKEPISMPEREALLKKFHLDFEEGKDFVFGIFDKDEKTLIGSTGLHTRLDADSREIGYWINSLHHGKGYATEAVRALVKVAFMVEDLSRIVIKCADSNLASAAIPPKLGFKMIERTKGGAAATSGHPLLIWEMRKDDFSNGSFAEMEILAFNRKGINLFLHP
ncbi:GNAT family N-acetyltransferase [Flavihumibacter sp. ZG627]|uniref:GNAT family N-acetyltransferase n=1 Tax=Flavihumibacter sp. ZG627 TaxID=1463156 RepID=UPI000694432C|nr:GNAT family N-acetyltransferase [Flavihumibacter sp. ZG627]